MTPNELLLWLSARKEGSWPQFRGAVETLDLANTDDEEEKDTSLPLHQRVRFNLERLGHVEFDAAACEDGWRVVPPSLALSPTRWRSHCSPVRGTDTQSSGEDRARSSRPIFFCANITCGLPGYYPYVST